ncbi:MAG: ribosome maturation factor RimM [bacterium]
MNSNEPQMVIVGEIVRPHGLAGTVKVRATTDDPQRFSLLDEVKLQRDGRTLGEYRVERVQIGKSEVFVKFYGVDDRNQAETLRGASLMIPSEARVPAPADQYYHFEIIGLPAYTAAGEPLGEIVNIETFPAHDVWVIRNGDRERLVPAVEAFIKEVDVQNRRIVIVPIPGLLEDVE